MNNCCPDKRTSLRPKGRRGPPGPTGAIGPPGPRGPVGPAGVDGIQGIDGDGGVQGLAGEQGIQGPIGLTGPAGPVGPAGENGSQGIQGPPGESSAAASIVDNEIPSGSIDGNNVTFNTSFAYVANSTKLYLNGLRQRIGSDYNESGGTTVTMLYVPQTNDSLLIDYRK